ncbi:MFS transporter [Actinosynnema sp. CS-041913]|uniref:MFS transporter n=1 Tax=Actinosynnema sp. CS-041913 TaxID=3239917 RepID=UPI003D8AFE80
MSTTLRSGLGRTRSNWAMVALFLGAFVVGTAELVVVGVLNIIVKEMEVSISTAGTLVTAYSLGISIGGPLLTALTIKFGRRFLLWLSFLAYVLGNVAAAFAVNFGMLVTARIITGALHGLFMGVAFAVAAALVPPDRMGRAIAVVFGGFAVSTALGLPLGNLIGQGFGWQAAFVAVIVLGVIALVAALAFIPQVPNTGTGGVGAQAKHAFAPRVLAVLAVGFLLLGGQYAALTYITPFLEQVTGISGSLISAFLFAYGIANAIGTFGGGWAADRNASRTLVIANVVLIGALLLLWLAGDAPVAVAAALFVWGVVGFGLVPSLQHRVVTLAGPGRDLAATLPQSAVTAGIAIGALVGGWAVAAGGPDAAVVTGLIAFAIALPGAWAISLLKVPTFEEPTAGPAAPSTVPASN